MATVDGEFGQRLQRALVMLDGKGLPRGTSAPLLYRGLWKLGFRVPPPLMMGFFPNALLMGAFSGRPGAW
ncbi:transmembrane protein [Stenotrophomonas acidaminiphila]|uniref:Transmembrane protein n=1 Tax=Stenotrophomonas acidaminiphila TaxID=128780 RepID=A0A0S1AW28_9GAMM|nr:transmembrane protein [Stenotrophomonas acidaminiphila]